MDPRKGGGVVEALIENKKKPGKYSCSRCGEPLTLQQCWIGNEGLLCRKHIRFRSVERNRLERQSDSPPDSLLETTEPKPYVETPFSWMKGRGRVAGR
jgi:hypothetical protein